MTKSPQQQLTRHLASEWAKQAQIFMLDGLMAESRWTIKDIAFHGGTSLNMSWSSPRFSEDLDFLLSREVKDIDKIVKSALKRAQEHFWAIDPEITVELKNKTKNEERMPYYQVLVSKKGVLGKSMVKVEFWRVDPEYLKKYPTQFRQPRAGDWANTLSNPVPAADLMTAFCDKLTAFSTRPHLKWRDIYDLWWIGTQSQTDLDIDEVKTQFLHNLSAYQTPDEKSPVVVLRQFLNISEEELIQKADPDLKNWLPEKLWERLYPDGVSQMVKYTRYVLDQMATALELEEKQEPMVEKPNLKRVPR